MTAHQPNQQMEAQMSLLFVLETALRQNALQPQTIHHRQPHSQHPRHHHHHCQLLRLEIPTYHYHQPQQLITVVN